MGVTITIIYDNNRCDNRLGTGWGFSCLVRLPEMTILFDTGGNGSILLNNMTGLRIDPQEIDAVILSHAHGDHVGGLADFLEQNSDVTIYMPASFPQQLKARVRHQGARIEEVHRAGEISHGVLTTGELDGGIREQSLVIDCPQGLMVITGCAHPGIVNIVQKAKEIGESRVHLVLGGFHLGSASASTVEGVIKDLVRLGVDRFAPCHCSGNELRRLLRQRFGLNCLDCGVGKVITINE